MTGPGDAPAHAETSGVPFPPPLIHLALIGVGLGAERLAPGPALPDGARWLGAVVFLGAFALFALAARELRRARTPKRVTVAYGPDAPSRLLLPVGGAPGAYGSGTD